MDTPDRQPLERSHRAEWVVSAIRSAEAEGVSGVAVRVRQAGDRSRWLWPVRYLGHTLDAHVAGTLVLLTTARLALLELVPALWLGAMTWDWRVHATGKLPLPDVHGAAAAGVVLLVLVVNVVAYWCNVTLAFALVQPPPVRVRRALAAAAVHGRLIMTWALVVGLVHAFVSVVLPRTSVGWHGLGLTVVVVTQMWGLVALPATLAGLPRKGLAWRDRLAATAVTGLITLVALAPGLLLTRIGLLVLGTSLAWVGIAVLAVAIALQIVATSSVHTVSLATKVAVASRSADDSTQEGA